MPVAIAGHPGSELSAFAWRHSATWFRFHQKPSLEEALVTRGIHTDKALRLKSRRMDAIVNRKQPTRQHYRLAQSVVGTKDECPWSLWLKQTSTGIRPATLRDKSKNNRGHPRVYLALLFS